MSRRSLITFSLSLAIVLATVLAHAAAGGLLSLLPACNVVRGWVIVAGADKQAATTQAMYSLYDGAVPSMLKDGITSAAQRAYRDGRGCLTVDIFRFSSPGKAMAYYARRKAEIRACGAFGAITGLSQGGVTATSGRTTIGYAWNKGYCTSISVNSTTAADQEAVRRMARHINGKIGALK
ncbi:MAG: hypothetical protein ABFE07_14075 [Armatimonadia bacterium]